MAICDDYGIPHSEFQSWSSEDQDKAVAYRIHQSKHCPRCGSSEEEWELDRFAYEPEVRRCRGCEMVQLTEENLREERGTAGMYVRLKKADNGLPAFHKHSK